MTFRLIGHSNFLALSSMIALARSWLNPLIRHRSEENDAEEGRTRTRRRRRNSRGHASAAAGQGRWTPLPTGSAAEYSRRVPGREAPGRAAAAQRRAQPPAPSSPTFARRQRPRIHRCPEAVRQGPEWRPSLPAPSPARPRRRPGGPRRRSPEAARASAATAALASGPICRKVRAASSRTARLRVPKQRHNGGHSLRPHLPQRLGGVGGDVSIAVPEHSGQGRYGGLRFRPHVPQGEDGGLPDRSIPVPKPLRAVAVTAKSAACPLPAKATKMPTVSHKAGSFVVRLLRHTGAALLRATLSIVVIVHLASRFIGFSPGNQPSVSRKSGPTPAGHTAQPCTSIVPSP